MLLVGRRDTLETLECSIPPSKKVRDLRPHILTAFMIGRGLQVELKNGLIDQEKQLALEANFAHVWKPSGYSHKGCKGISEALQATMLFGKSYSLLREVRYHSAVVYNAALDAAVRSQQLLTQAYLTLCDEHRMQLRSFGMPQEALRIWKMFNAGAFSVARVINGFNRLRIPVQLASIEQDKNGVDLLCYPPLLQDYGVCVQVYSCMRCRPEWVIYPIPNEGYVPGEFVGYSRKVRKLLVGTRMINAREKAKRFIPLMVRVPNQWWIMHSLENDPLCEQVQELIGALYREEH